ncbi:MAG: hypothetical protein J6I35_01200 [Ruminobacter sp.]|uniref:type II secretion system protein GspL n=1 Tax=Ruminobacter sp. TaxID=2774296 RepID=UPI001B6A2092|nr:type II secretion system protein GspL [Ruminobacter sp.]MBP3748159.1 hypothetical protein [Ruminobacter sp.]
MSEYLFIRPNLSMPRDYCWFAYDDVSKNIISSGHSDTVEGLAQTNTGSPERSVVLLYPASACIYRNISFPGKLKKSAYNSLLYVIEDDLAEDVESFSVRVLEKQGNDYSVLIYRHSQLRSLEKALELLGLSVDIIVPDVLTLPLPDKNQTEFTGYVMKFNDVWLVRNGKNSGMEVQEEWLPFLAGSGDSEKKFISLSELSADMKDKWQESLVESVETVIAEGAIKNKLNLSSKQRKKNYQIKFVRSWAKVAVLVILMFALWFVNMSYRTKSIMQETMDYRNQQRNLFKQISNSNGNVNDPVGEMKRLIENSSPIGTDEGFVDLSKILVPYVSSKKNIEMVSLKFDRSRKTFTLQFLADGSFDKDAFINDLNPDFSGNFTDSKPSRDRMLNTVQLRRLK